MPLQNRVDPFGRIHAVPDRGLFMGNRGGCFHRPDKTLKPTHWVSRNWIICVTSFKDRKRELMSPGLYTELFFLDEATALAAGHRPCFECQYTRAMEFKESLIVAGLIDRATKAKRISDAITGEVQAVLNGQSDREKVCPSAFPDGTIFADAERPFLKWRGQAWPWSFSGYGPPEPLPHQALRLSPAWTVQALRAGYEPAIHPSLHA